MNNSIESNKQREYILDILIEVFEKDRMSHLVLRESLNKYKELSKIDRAFITRVSEGTIERSLTIDYIVDCFSKTKIKKMKPVIRNIIRMSVYQIMYMDSVPDSAACNEAVKLAKKRGFSGLSGFVNGVLRNISRNKDEITYPKMTDEVKYLSIMYSIPEWLVEKLVDDFGKDIAKACFEGMYSEKDSSLIVRVNISKASVDKVVDLLEKQGIKALKSPYAKNALILSEYDNVEEIEAFKKGFIQIQDISSMLVGQVSGVKNGDICMDLCSAPGGKTMHIADLNPDGKIYARDVSEYKKTKILENVNRIGYENIVVDVKDATVFDEEMEGKADLVIADVPCSGIGIMGKKTDIKYRMKKETMDELVVLSKKILKNSVKYLKKDGILMFSTCTMNKQENEEVRQWLLDTFSLEPVSVKDELGDELIKEDVFDTAKDGHLQMFITNDHDGFYLAKFRKL